MDLADPVVDPVEVVAQAVDQVDLVEVLEADLVVGFLVGFPVEVVPVVVLEAGSLVDQVVLEGQADMEAVVVEDLVEADPVGDLVDLVVLVLA